MTEDPIKILCERPKKKSNGNIVTKGLKQENGPSHSRRVSTVQVVN